MIIKPVGRRVLIRKIKEETKSKNGIIVPDSLNKRDRYEIVECGDGKDDNGENVYMPFLEGDIVYLEKYAGNFVEMEDEQLIIVKIGDVMAIEQI